MKKQWIIGAVGIVVVILAVWIFWPKGASTHTRVIPADATALMSFDVQEFIRESELTDEKIKQILPEAGDLASTGIDLEQPVYAFVSGQGMNGLLMAVKDGDLLRKYLTENSGRLEATPVEEQQGYSWSSVSRSFVLGFDDEVLLVMGPTVASAQAELRQQMLQYLKQDRKESVQRTPLYKNLEKQEGILKMTVSMETFPEYYALFRNMGMPEHADFSKLLMTASLRSESGRVVLHAGLIAEDKGLSQKMKAVEDMSRQISGEFLNEVEPNTVFWMGANLRGEKLMTLLGEVPALRLYLMAMNQVMDFGQMIRKIDGDIALSVTADRDPGLCLQAQMADLSFLEGADYWEASARRSGTNQFEKVGEDLYRIRNVMNRDLYMGVKDKNLLLTSNRETMSRRMEGLDEALLAPYKKDILGSKFYVWTHVGALGDLYRALEGEDLGPAERYFNKIEAIALRSTNATTMDLILYMKSKDNGLKQLFE